MAGGEVWSFDGAKMSLTGATEVEASADGCVAGEPTEVVAAAELGKVVAVAAGS